MKRPLHVLPFLALCLLLPFLVQGCAAKKTAPPTFSVAEDPQFLSDLARAGEKGAGGIRIVAPASGMGKESLEEARGLARRLGVVFPVQRLDQAAVPYNAGSDEERLADLADALQDQQADIVWAIRGGYGSSRILPALSRLPAQHKAKVFIGYSDMTFLHQHLQRLGWRTVHGAMFGEMTNPRKDPENFRRLAALLSGRVGPLRYDGIAPFNQEAKTSKKAIEGLVDGGNLTCLASAAGTPWALKGAGKILFLEDVNEPGYKIDRMLTQLAQSGAMNGVRAVLLGEFSGGDQHVEFALKRFADSCGRPVFRTDLFGHGRKNYPLVFNAPAALYREDGEQKLFSLSIDATKLP